MTKKPENYEVLGSSDTGLIKAWIRELAPVTDQTDLMTDRIEPQAQVQLERIAKMPFIFKWLAVMPDVHLGKGATVGSVIATDKAIIPAAVGVDLGCGMMARRTDLTASDLPDNLKPLRIAIEQAVPHGRTRNGGPGDEGAFSDLPHRHANKWLEIMGGYEDIIAKHPGVKGRGATEQHLGTLGTGNHFIEICLDEEQRVWVMLHSGSRGVGNRIGSYFIERAKMLMADFFVNLPDGDLAFIPTGNPLFQDYVDAVEWAQEFARINRELMMDEVLAAMESVLQRPFRAKEMVVNCHHNYISRENHFGQNVWVTRKGAVRARKGDLGIIPGSMGARSYIVRGLGNKDSFTSCSHGAGRAMSRAQAKKRFTLSQHVAATEGVECRKDEDVIDETPMAYKDIDLVMKSQSDLVEIAHTLKQILCVKG